MKSSRRDRSGLARRRRRRPSKLCVSCAALSELNSLHRFIIPIFLINALRTVLFYATTRDERHTTTAVEPLAFDARCLHTPRREWIINQIFKHLSTGILQAQQAISTAYRFKHVDVYAASRRRRDNGVRPSLRGASPQPQPQPQPRSREATVCIEERAR